MRFLIGLVALALLVAALGLFLGSPPEPLPAAAAIEQHAAPATPPEGPRHVEAPSEAVPRPERTQVAAPAAVEATDAEQASPAPGISGTIVLLLEDGRRIEDSSGTLALRVWSGTAGRSADVEVTAGRFLLKPDADAAIDALAVLNGTLDGHPVGSAAENANARVLPEDGEFTLICRQRGSIVLEVRSAETRALLGHVDVARMDNDDTHPGNEPNFVVSDRLSPVAIDQADLDRDERRYSSADWLVRSPGYAWKEVRVDLRGERQIVMLQPGGSATVQVVGVGKAQDLRLFVTTEGHKTRIERRLSGDIELRLENLPLLPLTASVQRGEWFMSPKVFGKAVGEVCAEEELSLLVEVAPEATNPTELYSTRIELLAPAGWTLPELTLDLDLVESVSGSMGYWNGLVAADDSGDLQGPQTFLFDVGDQPAGVWVVEFSPPRWRANLTIDRAMTHQLVLPELATLTVDVTDPATGLAVEGTTLSWYSDLDGPSNGVGSKRAEPLETFGQFLIRAPAGSIVLHPGHPDYGSRNTTHELAPGQQTLSLELSPKIGFELRLMDGETNVTPPDWGFSIELEQVGFEGQHVRRRISQPKGMLRMTFNEPGLYRLTFPDVPGYETPAPVEVELPAGELIDLPIEVHLQR